MILDKPKGNTSQNNPAKAILLFTLLGVLPSAIGFLLLPIYLKHYDPSEYGLLVIFNLLGSFYGSFSNLKLDAAMRTTYYDYYQDDELRIKFIKSIFTTAVMASFFTLLAMLTLGYLFFDGIFKGEELSFYPFGPLVLISVFFGQIPSVFYVVLKNEYRLKIYSSYIISFLLMNVLFQYLLIVIYELGVLGAILGMLASRVLICFVLLIKEWRLLDFNVDKEMLNNALKFSIPFLPFIFLNWFFMNGDRILLERILNLEAVGKYALLVAIIGLVRLIFSAMDNAFRPYVFEYFKIGFVKDNPHLQKMYFWYICIGLLAFSGILMAGTNLHLITDNSKYLSIVELFPLATLLMLPRLLSRLAALKLIFLKRSAYISTTTAISLVLLVVLFFTLIPSHGLKGALYAIGIMNIVQFAFYYFGARTLIVDKVYLGDLAIAFLSGTTVCLLTWYTCEALALSIDTFGLLQFLSMCIILLLFYFIYPKYRSLSVK